MSMHLVPTSMVGLVLASLTAAPAIAQCPSWSTGFSYNGLSSDPHTLTVFDDGTGPALYAGGGFSLAGDVEVHGIAKRTASGWAALAGGVNASVYEMTVFDDGSGPALYACGNFTIAGGVSASMVAKWNGSTWSALGSGMSGTRAGSWAIFDDGTGPALYAGGKFSSAGGIAASNVAKWNGATWSPLGSGITGGASSEVQALKVFDDGSGPALYATGAFTNAGGVSANSIAKWNGSSWSALGGGLTVQPSSTAIAYAFAVFDDGAGPALYVGGAFDTAGGASIQNIAKWNGSSWSSLGMGASLYVEMLTVYDDGSGSALYVGGEFTSAGGVPAKNIAKWNGSSWSALSSGLDYGPRVGTEFDDGSGPALYVGGSFGNAGGVSAFHIAKWKNGVWSGLPAGGDGLNGRVFAQAVHDDGSGTALYAGGEMTRAGGVSVANIARWNGSSWSAVGSGTDTGIHTLTSIAAGSGAGLYAGGRFTVAGGVSANNIAKWDGSSWSPLGSGLAGVLPIALASTVFDAGSGPTLYVGGDFTLAGGASASHIARWDGTTWSSVGGGTDGIVSALTVFDDGTGAALYAGGKFITAGGTSCQQIAKWNGSSWTPLGSGTTGHDEGVTALAVFDDGSGPALFAGGWFTTAGGVAANHIAKWNGSSWSSIGSGYNGPVLTLSVFDDGSGPALYAGGLAAGMPHPAFAKWNGSSWSLVGSGLGGPNGNQTHVDALAVFDDGYGPALHIGGQFVSANGIPAYSFTSLRACEHPGQRLCLGDGSGAACPCANTGAPGHGCNNSQGTGGASLEAVGLSSLAHDALVLTSSAELPSALSIFLQGKLAIAPANFGDGLRCAGGVLKRLYARNASAGSVTAPVLGDLSVSARSAATGDSIQVGQTRVYQVYYRDPNLAFCPTPAGNSWNVSNGLRIGWLP